MVKIWLNKKFLSLIIRIVGPRLIDSSGEGRVLQLKNVWGSLMGFLPDGDLIIVSLNYYSKNIYKYSFIDKPTNATLWEYSQIYDIEIPKSLNKYYIGRFIYQTKLFLFNKGAMAQWDLSTM